MIPSVVATAVLARIKADSTLWSGSAWTSALAGGAAWHRANPQSRTFPYVEFDIEFEDTENYFEGIGAKYSLTFYCFDRDTQTNGLSRLTNITHRLVGDAMLITGNRSTPTFGFHNHKLDLSTNDQGMTGDRLNVAGSSLAYSDSVEANVQTVRFTGRVSNQAVNV